MIYSTDFQNSIEQAFLEYGASVAQERAIPDVRDGLKIGLRQGLYAQYSNKLTHKNKFQKAQKSVAAAMSQSYVHGDAAMYDTFIRAAKPWSYRYPIEEAQGSYGTQCGPDTHSSPRYVEMRSGELAEYFFSGLKKNAIKEWYDNYDDTEKIPSVFPSIGFWNVINGTSGIAVAMATSVPQFNLREVNAALIKLIENPDIDFSAIYCAPDFATGGLITNAAEVRESLRNGKGASARIRAKLTYDAKKNCIIATELPYGVFTDTIISQLADVANDDENYGIERVVDHTKQFADIRIYLTPGANPSTVIKKLYKDTSLENWFSINMIMLDHGRFPRVFGWKEACQAYIDHIRECKVNELEYDYNVLLHRNHILDGLKIALANIDDIVYLIRHSESPATAKTALMSKYKLDEEQAKAILDMKLQRLANLEAVKVNTEYEENVAEMGRLQNILSTPAEVNKLLIAALEEVANKFGDARRTQLANSLAEEAEEIEEEEVYLQRTTTLIKVIKKPKNITPDVIVTTNLGNLSLVSNEGKLYHIPVSKILESGSMKIAALVSNASPIIFIQDLEKMKSSENIVFVTSDGFVKKSKADEYNYLGRQGSKMLKLKEGAMVTICTINCVTISPDVKNPSRTIPIDKIPFTGKTAMGTKIK